MNARKTVLLMALLCLGACGVKPAYVDPPEGAEHKEFPRTYPAAQGDVLPPGLEHKQ